MTRPATSSEFGAASYRQGAWERLEEARVLLNAQRFAGCIYLAGRGVEAMLRALVWKADLEYQRGAKSLETGHDLRALLTLVRNLGLVHDGAAGQRFTATIQRVSRLWSNNLRFAPRQFIETRWCYLGEIHGRRTLKQAAREYWETCAATIRECEVLWPRA